MQKEPSLEVALTKCILCGGDNTIVINKRLDERTAAKVKEMHGKIVQGHPPCPECQKHMKLGILLIGYDEEKSDPEEGIAGFYRSGKIMVVSPGVFERNPDMIGPELTKQTLEKRMLFMPHKDMLWLEDVVKNNTAPKQD